ncbi:MAG TPA: VRR-NUC domain-containing protein [Verrucomicrobiae bacterium]|jgi:hypothetical protein|nr:VRR-NUC domain-containing protein [Verrucomicrobiae bacterium]
MGLPKTLPENILRRLDPQARRALGRAGRTSAESLAWADARAERELQHDMENIMRQRNIWFTRSRMDKKTRARVGTPDFIIVLRGGRALAVEAKVEGGKVSADQEREFHQYFCQTDCQVKVVWNLAQFIALLDGKPLWFTRE